MMLVSAAAQKWSVDPSRLPRRERRGHGPGGQKRDLRRAGARRRPSCRSPKTPQLKAPKDFKYIGKPVKRLDTPAKVDGTARVRHRRQAARHAVRVAGAVPGDRRQGRELRRRAARRRMPGVKKVVQIDDGVAVVADTCWQAQDGARRARRSSGTRARARRSAPPASPRRSRPRRRSRARSSRSWATWTRRAHGAAEEGRGDLRAAVPGPRPDGADELHRATCQRTRAYVYGPTQFQQLAEGVAAAGHRPASPSRSRCTPRSWAAASGGASTCDYVVQAVEISKAVGGAGQAGVDARRRHDARLLPADQLPPDVGGSGRAGQAGRR